jgi:hypothetical protein
VTETAADAVGAQCDAGHDNDHGETDHEVTSACSTEWLNGHPDPVASPFGLSSSFYPCRPPGAASGSVRDHFFEGDLDLDPDVEGTPCVIVEGAGVSSGVNFS